MKKNQNAQLYAQALFDLARENGSIDAVVSDFALFLRLQEEEPGLRQFFTLSFFAEQEKVDCFDRIFAGKVSTVFQNFVKLLLAKKYFFLLPDIAQIYRQLADREKRQVRAVAFTVVPLSADELQKTQEIASTLMQKRAVVQNIVAPDIIGGIILQAEDMCIDASLKGKLDKLRKRLLALRPNQHAGA